LPGPAFPRKEKKQKKATRFEKRKRKKREKWQRVPKKEQFSTPRVGGMGKNNKDNTQTKEKGGLLSLH